MPRLNLFKITIPVLIAIFLFGTTCKKTTEDKQPVSNFSFDKAEYIAGEIIRITNTSVDASSYTWTLPDGTTTKSKDLDYTTAANIGNANLNFKLEAYSKGGKVDYSVKSVRVKAATGQLVIYDGYSPSFIAYRYACT